MMSEIRISVHNEGAFGGIANTPVWFGLHDGSFDLFNDGEVSSPGLEALAEDGTLDAIGSELSAADSDAQGGAVFGARGPMASGEFAAATIIAENPTNDFISLASMVLPSNDAFFGTAEAVQLFDVSGEFLGPIEISFNGSDVRDAGTEVNTELDAAFINQTAPNTGITENGVVGFHPGFNGSMGNPVGEGDQIILGGTNAFGQPILSSAADFTQPDFDIATIYINRVESFDLSAETTDQRFGGSGVDDLVVLGSGNDVAFGRNGNDDIAGGHGNDSLRGGNGIDILNGDAGNDLVAGGNGADQLDGGDDHDIVIGGGGNDLVVGGAGNDFIAGNNGDDVLHGGTGNDTAIGGNGADLFMFTGGDGDDIIRDFLETEGDSLLFDVDGIDSFADLQATGSASGGGTTFDFADAGSLHLQGLDLNNLTSDAVILV